jgi:putative membrane-bound dehydrogenase-like protein
MSSACFLLFSLFLQSPEPRDLGADFTLPEGLAVTLWAESPHLFNPAAIDVDERGRIWVAEAVNYRTWGGRNPGLRHPEGDRVVVLEDTDGDGACDASHVFVQDPDLVAPLGIAVIAGKVYVSCSPNLFVYEDTDGDGRSDRRETLLTGFGGPDHDHGLHSVVCGPDGLLYFTAGNAGPHLVTDRSGWTLRSGSVYRGGGAFEADNKPGLVSDDGRVWTGGLVLRVGVDGTGLEVLAHNFRNNYEVALDSQAELYVTDNDDDGNGGCRTTWVMRGGNYGFFSNDGSRSWQADRRPGQDNWTAHWHQDDPGVMPAGTRNGPGGPTGCMVYEGDLLARWVGGAVVNTDAGARVVYAHFPEPKGAGIELRNTDLLRARGDSRSASWFRPSDVAAGIDGTLYVADWWDPGVGGHAAGDGEAYGRILRIAPKGTNPRAMPIDVSTVEGALGALGSPAVNVRELGRRALLEAGEAARPPLAAATRDLADEPLGARAAWVLDDLGLPGSTSGSPAFRVRRALRRRAIDGQPSVLVPEVLEGLTDAAARREALCGMRAVPSEVDGGVLAQLSRHIDSGDRVLVEAFGLAAEGHEGAVYDGLVKILEPGDPVIWSARFEALAWRLHPTAAISGFRARALSPELSVDARRRAIDALAFTGTREAAEAVLAAAQAGPEDLRAYAAWWIRFRDTNDWRAFGLGQRVATGDLESAELLWKSETLSSGRVDVDVDVSGAETLWLVVGDGGNGNGCDWADWIDPVLEGPTGRWKLAETAWSEAEAGWGSVQVGKNCSGGALRNDGQPVTGIGTHAPSRIAFAVPAGATRFRAQVGPDDGGVTQGCGTSIVFEVRATRPPPAPRIAEWEARMLDATKPLRERAPSALSMAADPQGALRLIRLREANRLPDDLLEPVADAIHRNPDLGVRALASAAFPRPGLPSDFPSIAELAGMVGGADPRHGRELFEDRTRAQCIVCHAYRLGDAPLGGDIGPELTAVGDKLGSAEIVDAILNPSAAIAHGYDTWVLETADGTLWSGFLLADGATIVLKDTQGQRHVLDAADVVERTKQTLSTMPEGLALGLSPEDLCDLVAFLRAPQPPQGLLGAEHDPAAYGITLGEPVVLFDGTSLDAWTFHLPDGVPMTDVWSVEDGILLCKGNPIGYLRTREAFESYHLAVEWRFDPAKGSGNSGVLLRVNGEDKVWPRSIEAQLQSRNAGDIWNIDKMAMQVALGRTSGRHTTRAQPCSEHPLGEWNRYDIWLVGPRLELYVNGVLQNVADWCETLPGTVALQSEGAPIEFRSVVLTPVER